MRRQGKEKNLEKPIEKAGRCELCGRDRPNLRYITGVWENQEGAWVCPCFMRLLREVPDKDEHPKLQLVKR